MAQDTTIDVESVVNTVESAVNTSDAVLQPIAYGEEGSSSRCNCGGCIAVPCAGCDATGYCCPQPNFWTKPALTGDWFGARSRLQESGMVFRGAVTQFGFGVAGGINVPAPSPFGQGDQFKYTGRGEYDLIFDLEKFGGPAQGKFLIGAQHWWGHFGNVSLNTGAFAPSVFAAALPPIADEQGNLFLTDFLFTQPLSEQLVVFVGKKNVVGTADQDIFAGGDGTDQFVNQALVANPAYLLGLPYSSFTAGIVLPKEWGGITAFVWDPRDRTTKGLDLNDLFVDGIIVGGQVTMKTNFFNRPGQHHIGGLWKDEDLLDLSAAPPPSPMYNYSYYPYPQAPPGLPAKRGAYTIYYGFDQYFQTFPGERRGALPTKPPRGWGLFGRASISDANPTPVRYFLSFGIGGDTRAGNDRGDSFGIGWYYVGSSDKFGPVAQAVVGPRDGTGVELYYRFQLLPWLAITPDVQYVKPGLGLLTTGDDAFVYGLRAKIDL